MRGYKLYFGDNTWEESSRDSCTDGRTCRLILWTGAAGRKPWDSELEAETCYWTQNLAWVYISTEGGDDDWILIFRWTVPLTGSDKARCVRTVELLFLGNSNTVKSEYCPTIFLLCKWLQQRLSQSSRHVSVGPQWRSEWELMAAARTRTWPRAGDQETGGSRATERQNPVEPIGYQNLFKYVFLTQLGHESHR